MKKLVVIKLGGSVITKKSEGKLEVDAKNLKRVCREVSQALKEGGFNLVVVHGAGPFGHVLAKKYLLAEGLRGRKQVEGMAKTHASMEKLNAAVVSALQDAGVPAIAFQPSAGGVLEDGRLVAFPLEAAKRMLEIGLVPVGYGDVLVDTTTGVNILSGDHLVPYLALELAASRVVIATDVDGIYDGDPKDGKARRIPVITRKNIDSVRLGGSKGVDVTGGMRRKVWELLEIAGLGTSSQVVSGLKAGSVRKALSGDNSLGTLIRG